MKQPKRQRKLPEPKDVYWAYVYDGDESYFSDGPFNDADRARHSLAEWVGDYINENLDRFSESEAESIGFAYLDLLSGMQNKEYEADMIPGTMVFLTYGFGLTFEVQKVVIEKVIERDA